MPRTSANRKGEEQHSNTTRHDAGTKPGRTGGRAADKEERGGGSETGEAARTTGETGN